MRYLALASDYDGTVAHHGVVEPSTLAALNDFRKTGRHLIMVTGRELPELQIAFPGYPAFQWIVAENGALLYDVAGKTECLLAEPPPPAFAKSLRQKGVNPLSVGRVIVSTLDDFKGEVLSTIQELGLELHVIFNKGSLMVLPSGVNKATGLRAVLKNLGLSAHNVVAVGDAENDHAFLAASERGVAVANALPALLDRADLITAGKAGQGVEELIDRLIKNDLHDVPAKDNRDTILLGERDGREIRVSAYDANILLAGTSGGGKSTLTTGVMERLNEARYQFFAIDPEGDYQNFQDAMVLGDSKRQPAVDEVLAALANPEQSLILNLLGLPADDRPTFFESLMPRIQELRARTGRPHWLIFDEAHHLMPVDREPAKSALPKDVHGLMLVTLEPDRLPPSILAAVRTLLAVGQNPDRTVATFCQASGDACPHVPSEPLKKGTALLWSRGSHSPVPFQVADCKTERVRHSRKYASAELTPDRSFFFRGPAGKLSLRAQNLMTFVQLLEGVDDETWLFHLQRREYSQWFRDNIKSAELADAAAEIEAQGDLPPAESRALIKQQVERRYTLPA